MSNHISCITIIHFSPCINENNLFCIIIHLFYTNIQMRFNFDFVILEVDY